MAEIHRLTDIDRAEHEASQWVARLHADDVSAIDQARFQSWLKADPRHSRAYGRLNATWHQFVAEGPLVRAVHFAESMNAASRVRSRGPRAWAWGAAIAAVAAVATWSLLARPSPQKVFQTALGEHASIALPDGSLLELNSNSSAREEYSDNQRVIRLERGEAFFQVRHDPRRPFRVIAGESWVHAVGTAFDVYLGPTDVRVTVSEGTVRVGRADQAQEFSDRALARSPGAVVTAGHQVEIRGPSALIRSVPPAELTRSVAWRSGTLYFENQPLIDVVNELGRYCGFQVVVNNPKLAAMRIGGTFQASEQGAETLLAQLQTGFGLKVRRESDHVYIDSAE